jgi:hypothetical protein
MQQSNGKSETATLNNPPNSQAANRGEQNAESTLRVEPRPPRNQRDNSATKSQQQPEGEGSEPKPLSLAELFAEDGDSDSESGSGVHDDPSAPPQTIEAAAKRLGLKPEQVYAIKVPMPNGAEAVSVGDLKDRIGELVELDTREMQFDQRRIKAEGDLLRAQTEMRGVLSLLPPEVVQKLPALTEKVRKQHVETQRRERQLTLEHIPEWQDEQRCTQDMDGMIGFLSEWGFDESFLGTVVDHRAMKFIRDMYLRDAKIKRAMKDVKVPARRGLRPSAKPAKQPAKPSQNTPRRERVLPDQQSRIMAFLNRE